MYKLLALDIDDTLTQEPRHVPQRNVEAVRRAQEAGFIVTLATGRGYYASSDIWRQLEIQGPVINYGGALIHDTQTGSAIYSTEISNELVQSVLSDAAERKIHAHLYQGDTIVYEKENDYAQRYSAVLGLPKRMDSDIRHKVWHSVPKVLLMTTEEQALELIPQFQKKYENVLKVSGSSKGFIEFNHPDAHKGSAVKWLADRLGIPREEVAAVGDNTLDAEMIQWAGLGCAMGNAKEDVKVLSDLVLPSCSEHGVAWLIDHVLLEREAQG